MSNRALMPCLLVLVACTSASPPRDADVSSDADAASDSSAATDASSDTGVDASGPPLGLYRGACDGSAAVALDATHFLSFDDETQTWRIFTVGLDGTAVQSADFGVALNVTDETDVEDATRVGDRIYAITSHGRNKNGVREDARYRFFAFDLAGTIPSATLTLTGSTADLLEAMLDADNYQVDDADVRALLTARSDLSTMTVANLAPKVNGTAIEGLTVLPDGTTLAIGFRNPQIDGDAIVVTLTNASAVLGGATPEFDRVIRMDLDGLGVRTLSYDATRSIVWIIAGPRDASPGPFKLYSWTGYHADAPVVGPTITPPANSAPEALLTIAGSSSLRVLYDQGAVLFSGTECKDLGGALRRFSDALVPVP